jgi:hypothetical protein
MKCRHETNSYPFLILFEKEREPISFIIQLLETVKKLEHMSISITFKIRSCKTKIFFFLICMLVFPLQISNSYHMSISITCKIRSCKTKISFFFNFHARFSLKISNSDII